MSSAETEVIRLRNELLMEREAHRKTKQSVTGLRSAVVRLQGVVLRHRLELETLKLETGNGATAIAAVEQSG
jgi:hypothetical protein